MVGTQHESGNDRATAAALCTAHTIGYVCLARKEAKNDFPQRQLPPQTGGFAPYANRFNNGGYIHGVPTNAPAKKVLSNIAIR